MSEEHDFRLPWEKAYDHLKKRGDITSEKDLAIAMFISGEHNAREEVMRRLNSFIYGYKID